MHVSSIETQAPSIQKPETDIWIPPKNTILAKQPLIDVKGFGDTPARFGGPIPRFQGM